MAVSPTNGHEVQIVVGSRFENVELVQVVLEDCLERWNVDEDARHWIGLAVREAVANAIKHGNREDPDKQVEVDLMVDAGELVVRVRDQGPGFNPDLVSDPLAPENLLRPGGRGIFYIRRLMDGVEYRFGDSQGTEIILRKRIADAGADAPSAEEST
jgi:serine/threonine-protein kinase RsbW